MPHRADEIHQGTAVEVSAGLVMPKDTDRDGDLPTPTVRVLFHGIWNEPSRPVDDDPTGHNIEFLAPEVAVELYVQLQSILLQLGAISDYPLRQ